MYKESSILVCYHFSVVPSPFCLIKITIILYFWFSVLHKTQVRLKIDRLSKNFVIVYEVPEEIVFTKCLG